MSHAAKLGALGIQISGGIGLQPHIVAIAGHHIHLAANFGHPETVDHIDRFQPYVDRLARRDMQLVSEYNLFIRVHRMRVTELEPPLVPDSIDHKPAFGRGAWGVGVVENRDNRGN